MAQFQPGNQAAVGYGRPPKAKELQTLDEIKQNFPPDKIAAMLLEAYELAKRTNSARGILQVTQVILDYTVGRPAPMEQDTDQETVQMLIQLLQPRPADPPAIEVVDE